MWFYDSRWFFNFKISVKCYKLGWLLPLLIHLMLAGLCFYNFMDNADASTCEASLKLWLFSRAFFSVLISINILFFILKISNVYKKEHSFFENSKKIYPHLVDTIENYDFWIRRKSLISTPGVLLLFLGIISAFWSYIIINLYYFEHQFNGCNEHVITFLKFHSFIIFIGNIPLFIVIFVLLFIKIASFISAYMCPGLLISLSKMCPTKMVKYDSKSFE